MELSFEELLSKMPEKERKEILAIIQETLQNEVALKKLDALFAKHGNDYVVDSRNHPEILREWNDALVKEMEAEIAARSPQ